MALRLEDYAMIGDLHTAALVGRNGSIDWLCLPRFDSGACFTALLGDESNGFWRIVPQEPVEAVERSYREGTLILETEFRTASGSVLLTDFMPPRHEAPYVMRIVECTSGRVPMRMDLVIRFDYGSIVPWVRRVGDDLVAIAGPDALCFRTPVRCQGQDMTTVAQFELAAGETVPFSLSWFPSHRHKPQRLDASQELPATDAWWREWTDQYGQKGPAREAVLVSLAALRGLIFEPTGGIVAAATTSLPEEIGGVRNWDYRFCWVRDATLTLYALLTTGYTREATRWRDWLLRALAGEPQKLQIMYGLGGERRLTEIELPWLAGYENSRPVRIGNAASGQFQLDVYGELADMLFTGRRLGMTPTDFGADMTLAVMDFLESEWKKPDDGIWEVRGGRRDFVHSKVMAWCAFDRAVDILDMIPDAPADLRTRWQRTGEEIHRQVCREGYDRDRNTFTQYYGSKALDASCLLIPQVGFLPPLDERVIGTVEAIQRELTVDGLVMRYSTDGGENVDGLPPGEAAFVPCSFWLADDLCLMGRMQQGQQIFDRLLSIRNDVGLLSEEYDTGRQRLVGNFPQAFSHVGLVNTAHNLTGRGPAQHRHERDREAG